MHEKKIQVFNNFSAHPDHPSVAHSHRVTLIKKIVALFSSLRIKHQCKLVRQTELDKKVRKKLSKLILFKNQ